MSIKYYLFIFNHIFWNDSYAYWIQHDSHLNDIFSEEILSSTQDLKISKNLLNKEYASSSKTSILIPELYQRDVSKELAVMF